MATPPRTSRFGGEGVAARALLATRGLTAERIAEAKATSAGLATLVVQTGAVTLAERDAAEKAMWSWYLEWSTIARVAIKERYILRALGFRRKGRPDGLEGDGLETDGDQEGSAALRPSDAQSLPALPSRASPPDDTRRSTLE